MTGWSKDCLGWKRRKCETHDDTSIPVTFLSPRSGCHSPGVELGALPWRTTDALLSKSQQAEMVRNYSGIVYRLGKVVTTTMDEVIKARKTRTGPAWWWLN